MLRIERVVAERFNGVPIDHFGKVGIVPCLNLLHLMRRAEAVEEMQEGHTALDGGHMCDRTEIHNLLHVAGAKHRKTGLTASHNVRVIAENVERMRSKRSARKRG